MDSIQGKDLIAPEETPEDYDHLPVSNGLPQPFEMDNCYIY
jgi:hypothetical protein